MVDRSLRKRRAAEVRVDDDAGRVDRRAKARCACRRELALDSLDEVSRIRAGADLLARPVERAPCRGDDERPRRGAGETCVFDELVHGRQVAKLHARKCRTGEIGG
jgi:hypothetical protein